VWTASPSAITEHWPSSHSNAECEVEQAWFLCRIGDNVETAPCITLRRVQDIKRYCFTAFWFYRQTPSVTKVSLSLCLSGNCSFWVSLDCLFKSSTTASHFDSSSASLIGVFWRPIITVQAQVHCLLTQKAISTWYDL